MNKRAQAHQNLGQRDIHQGICDIITGRKRIPKTDILFSNLAMLARMITLPKSQKNPKEKNQDADDILPDQKKNQKWRYGGDQNKNQGKRMKTSLGGNQHHPQHAHIDIVKRGRGERRR